MNIINLPGDVVLQIIKYLDFDNKVAFDNMFEHLADCHCLFLSCKYFKIIIIRYFTTMRHETMQKIYWFNPLSKNEFSFRERRNAKLFQRKIL